MHIFRSLLLAALAAYPALAQAQTGPVLAVDAGAARLSISPDVYGINNYFADETAGDSSQYYDYHPLPSHLSASADLRVGSRRWGGEIASRYDWYLDAYNDSGGWFFAVPYDFLNTQQNLLPEGSRFNLQMEYTRMSGGKMMGTIPVLEWLPKARSTATSMLCSYSVAKYGPQLQLAPGFPDCGDGINRGGTAFVQNDPNDTATQTDQNHQADWVKYVVSKYGRANQGGVAIWSLDNEPVWWGTVHHDIHPQQQTYDETASRGIPYAAAVKNADPTALVTGPAAAHWASFFYSAADFVGAGLGLSNWISGVMTVPFYSNPVDRNAHGGVDFSSWYLQQFKAYDAQNNQRLLDYFDLHLYGLLRNPLSDQERLRSTRVLWDPAFAATDLVWGLDDQGNPALPRLIPRMHDWVNQNYPGTKTAITEYDFGAHKTIVGALVEADVLGVFGREGLDLAMAWVSGTTVAPGDPLPAMTTDPYAFAFRMYRNYDGIGGAFGETSVQATTGDPDRLSIFAAQRSDTALTILVLNKTTGDLASTIGISNFTPDTAAQVWQYSPANLNTIVRQPDAALNGPSISATFPAYSMTLFVLPASPSVLPVPKPIVAALQSAATYDKGDQANFAPGQMVIVYGTNLGPAHLDSHTVVGSNNVVSTVMDGVSILFNGIPAPMVYVSQNSCAAVVPYLAGLRPLVNVQVEYQGVRSDPLQVGVMPVEPGLFTVNAQGSGQAAMQNQDGITANSTRAPAPPGSVVVLWGTGEGATAPPGVDGRLATNILPKPVATCAAEIGGMAATVEYCGAAPSNMPGLFQVNARIDPSVASGDAVPVRVIIAGKASQEGVTMVVH
jgi:uncharacterized protein (TIGR03437 family)